MKTIGPRPSRRRTERTPVPTVPLKKGRSAANRPSGKAPIKSKLVLAQHAAQLEQEIKDSTLQLRETIGELEAFTYSVSHDMRGPLRAMQGYAAHLAEEYGSKLDARGVSYLHQIMRSAAQLDRLLQDLLAYTKILHSPVPMQPVDLDRLVRDLIQSLPGGQSIKPQISIKGILPLVTGNETLLSQCISNLLSNAIKFVAPSTTPCLEISSEVMNKSAVRLWFKDNGIGISPENHQRIFQLFERVHPTSEFEGSGMGLTIVRKAVDRMGAQAGLESALGKGTQFWIQLGKA